MNLTDIIVGPVFKIIDKIIPDPAAKAELQFKILKLNQDGEFKTIDAELAIAQSQAAINLEEAKSDNLFKSGWRPAVGWVCVIGLLYTYLGQPLLAWYGNAKGVGIPPSLDLSDLLILLGGMLGLGTLRTTEKLKGKA